MRKTSGYLIPLITGLFVAVSAGAALPVASTPVQVTVTVSGIDGQAPSLTSQDVMVFEDNARRPILDFKPVADNAPGRDLAILIDDSLTSNLSLQFPDLEAFVRSLPASTWVGVAYADHGAAIFRQDFTQDRGKVAAALRVTEGKINAGGSIFQSVSDLGRRWPVDGRARIALVISNGVDINRGVRESLPTLNPDLDQAVRDALEARISVYSIYAGGAARFTHSLFLLNNGQGSLNLIATETGGAAYFEGNETPVSFSPYLNRLRDALGRQYLLTFDAAAKPGVARLRVTTEIRGLKITAPHQVWVGAGSGAGAGK